jgi:hypothetical protein
VSGTVEELLRSIPPPSSSGIFNVSRLPGNPAFYAGRDASGNAALLIKASGDGGQVPLRLAGIEANYSVLCKVAEPGAPEQIETLTSIVCLSRERGIETYFASAAESLLTLLPPNPTIIDVAGAVQRLVDLFQKLRRPPRRYLAGLVGELCTLRAARDSAAAVASWRTDPEDRYDFVVGRLRMDVKSSSNRRRSHDVSFEQANPPPNCVGLIASTWVEAAGGGTSVAELLQSIEARLGTNYGAISRLRIIVADSLGETLPSAMDRRFDLDLATASTRYYDATTIPAIRPPLPVGVSALRFTSDFDHCNRLDVSTLERILDVREAVLLPPPRSFS